MRRTILQAKFAVRKSCPGLGHGLFATAMLRRGDFVLEYSGRRIPTTFADTLKSRYLFEIDRRWTIDGSSRANIARYINHSCAPNCEGDVRDGRVLIYAGRDIKKGEELTINYGEEYFDEFIRPTGCKCESCTRSRFSPRALFARLLAPLETSRNGAAL
jgi:SET domain-containing protein